jgi:hypothetical protein
MREVVPFKINGMLIEGLNLEELSFLENFPSYKQKLVKLVNRREQPFSIFINSVTEESTDPEADSFFNFLLKCISQIAVNNRVARKYDQNRSGKSFQIFESQYFALAIVQSRIELDYIFIDFSDHRDIYYRDLEPAERENSLVFLTIGDLNAT